MSNETATALMPAAKEWIDARAAAMQDVTPQTFDRLARAESALAKAIEAAEKDDGVTLL